jgi:chromosome segregation ATPase
MRNGSHSIAPRAGTGWLLRVLPLGVIAILMFGSAEKGQAMQETPAAVDLQESKAPPAENSPAQPQATVDPRIELADLLALREQIRNVQQQLDQLTRVTPGPAQTSPSLTPAQQLRQIDQQIQQLIRQREELAQTAQKLQTQLDRLPPSQEVDRRRLQGEVARIQGQLRGLDAQLVELRRERLRADYAAALQAGVARPPGEPNQASRLGAEVADLSARLRQLQDLVQRNQRELEQLRDRTGPRARELETAIQGLQRQMLGIQDRLRQTEQEQTREKMEAANRQRQTLEACVQELGRRHEELAKNVAALQQELRSFQTQMQQMEQKRAAEEEAVRRTAQQRIEELHAVSSRQQEEIRNQVRGLDERLKAAERTITEAESLRRELNGLRLDVQRLGQTMARLERERLDAQASLQVRVRQLDSQVCELRKDVATVQGSLNMMLSQMGRSTVGTAGCTWGW